MDERNKNLSPQLSLLGVCHKVMLSAIQLVGLIRARKVTYTLHYFSIPLEEGTHPALRGYVYYFRTCNLSAV